MDHLRNSLAVAAALLLASGLPAEVMDLEGLQGLHEVHRQKIRVESLDQDYYLITRLPRDYSTSGEQTYPVVYLLDGGFTFAPLAGYTNYLESAEELPALIVVGISYGTADHRKGNRRARDYTAPAEEPDYWGGAARFLSVLESEILPAVEGQFRVDRSRRVLFGQSLGGQLSLYAATHRPDLFWGLIASNPAVHQNLDFFLAPPPAERPDGRPLLFVSSGTEDEPRFRVPARRWIDHWTGEDERPWVLEARDLPGHGHFSTLPVAYRDGLRWIFAQTGP